MPAHVIAAADEIPPGGRKIVSVNGREIGVFNLGGEYYALRNICPHTGQGRCAAAASARSFCPTA